MNNDETIRLVLETTGTQSIEEAIRKLQGMKGAGKELADTYEVLERQVGEYALVEERTTEFILQGIRHRTEAEWALIRVLEEDAAATHRVTAAAGSLGGTMRKDGALGMGLLQGSYALQDFTSQLDTRGLLGAFGAVQNNIPGIISSIGGPAGLAGAVSVLAVGAGILWQNWDKVAGVFGTTKEQLPALGEGLEGIQSSLKGINKQIDDMEERARDGALSFWDEEKLGKLRELRDEGQKRLEDEKLVGSVGALDSKAAREIAAAVKQALAETGGGNAAAESLAMNMGISGREATAIVAGAMRGNRDDVDTLARNAPTFGTAYSTQFSPEAKRAAAEAKKSFEDEQKFQERRIRDIERTNDELTREGEGHERAWRAQVEREKERDFREGTAAADRAIREAEQAEKARRREEARNTPEDRLRREAQQTQAAVASEVERQWNAGGRRESPQQLQQIVRDAVGGLPAAGGDIAAAIQQAVLMDRERTRRAVMQNFGRMQVQSEQFGY